MLCNMLNLDCEKDVILVTKDKAEENKKFLINQYQSKSDMEIIRIISKFKPPIKVKIRLIW